MPNETPPRDPEADRLEDLSAEILARGALMNPELMTSVRLSVARMEAKLDNALATMRDIAVFQNDVRKHMQDSDKRLTKLEGRWSMLLIILGGAWALLLIIIGAVAYPLFAKIVEQFLG